MKQTHRRVPRRRLTPRVDSRKNRRELRRREKHQYRECKRGRLARPGAPGFVVDSILRPSSCSCHSPKKNREPTSRNEVGHPDAMRHAVRLLGRNSVCTSQLFGVRADGSPKPKEVTQRGTKPSYSEEASERNHSKEAGRYEAVASGPDLFCFV